MDFEQVQEMAKRRAVAHILAFGSELVTYEELIESLATSGDIGVADCVVCEEYEYYDADSLISKLEEVRADYESFAQEVLK
jgi:hypothetical protein